MALCPLWQSVRCTNQHRSMAHLCATVLKNGCVCGGRHAAVDCLDKPRLTIEQAEDVAPSRGSRTEASAREEPPSSASSSMPPLLRRRALPSSSRDLPVEEAAEARPSKRAKARISKRQSQRGLGGQRRGRRLGERRVKCGTPERPRGGLRPVGWGECSGGGGYCWHGCERAARAPYPDLRDSIW